jgi:hypothetical protein
LAEAMGGALAEAMGGALAEAMGGALAEAMGGALAEAMVAVIRCRALGWVWPGIEHGCVSLEPGTKVGRVEKMEG